MSTVGPRDGQDPTESPTAAGSPIPAGSPELADAPSAFIRASDFVADEVTGTLVRGHADFGPQHHTDQGVVHGGVYATIVEIAGGAGANAAVAERGQFAVGVHNATDSLRASTGGRALVEAEALWSATREAMRAHLTIVRTLRLGMFQDAARR